jgi:hypothetical protein
MKISYKKEYEYNFEKFDIRVVLNSDTSLFTVSGYLKFCDKSIKHDCILDSWVLRFVTYIEDEFKQKIDMRKFGNLFQDLEKFGFSLV